MPNAFLDLIYDLIFPPRCPYCDELTLRGVEACEKCAPSLDVEPHFRELENGVICCSAFRYEGVFKKAVINYKYNEHRQYCKPFALTCSRLVERLLQSDEFTVCTSVPSYHDLSGERFDQVHSIASRSAKLCGLEYRRLLRQTKRKEFQHSLGEKERCRNVKGIYEASGEDLIRGESVILFDDVVTTGSTLNACSDILLKAGAEKVVCVTLLW